VLAWLRGLLGGIETTTLPVVFEVDEDETGAFSVAIYKHIGGERALVSDFDVLARYGYTEIIQHDEERVIYALSDEDAETLLALKSLNPTVTEDGTLRVDMLPLQLQHLRKNPHVIEGPRAREITVTDTEVMPDMQIAYDSRKGLDIRIGYRDEDGILKRVRRIVKSTVGDYARAGKRFIRLPASLSSGSRQLLEGGHFSLALAKIPEFFARNLVIYEKEFNAVLVDQAQQIRIVGTEDDPLRPIVTLDNSIPGWLDFKVHYETGNVILPYELLLKRSNEKFRQINDTTWTAVDHEALTAVENKLLALNAISTGEGFRVPATEFVSLQAFVESIGGREALTAAYNAFLEQLTNFRGDPEFQLPEQIESRLRDKGIELRPYQREGIHWMDWLGRNLLHGLLADDMGLGKTVQTICALYLAYKREAGNHHSLIIAPRSVLLHWERELHHCFPGIWIHRYHGPKRDHRVFRMQRPAIFITTFSTAANDIDILAKDPFFYVVLDEATYIKNHTSKRAQAVKHLNAAHRIALSGTPVENRPAELWSIFDFLMQGHLGRYGTFVREFEHRIMEGDLETSQRLGRRIQPFILRRLKEDVAQDLPEKIEMTEWCELTHEQRQLYGGLQDALQQLRVALQQGQRVDYTTNILPVLTKLKQICDHPALVTEKKRPVYGRSEKFDWIVTKLDEIAAKGEQVVLFSHYLGMLDLFEVVLNEKDIRYIRIDGSTRDRQSLIDRFHEGQAVVALCSLQATSFGINLQAANHVIHADRWWNPAVEDQATDRVHRIGQDKIVYVYRILTEGTLEERIDALLTAKRGMADRVISAARQEITHGWTREELLEILQPLEV